MITLKTQDDLIKLLKTVVHIMNVSIDIPELNDTVVVHAFNTSRGMCNDIRNFLLSQRSSVEEANLSFQEKRKLRALGQRFGNTKFMEKVIENTEKRTK